MQFDWNTVYRGQMDLAPKTKYKAVWTVEKKQGRLSGQQAKTDMEEKEPQEEKAATCQVSEEGLMKLYLEQLKNAQDKAKNERDARNEELKAIKIAHNIMRGYKVPAQDESFLLTKNYKMYMAAKNLAMMQECRGEAKSVLGSGGASPDAAQSGTGDCSSIAAGEFLVGAGESAIANAGALPGQKDDSKSNVAFKNNSFADYNKSKEYAYGQGISSTNQIKKKKKIKARKHFYYNFKDVSSRIVRAKTSGIARQVLASAKQRSAVIRRKMRTGDYDDEALRIALLHAEAMERVAKKKMKHLQEEEMCKRGGPCNGDTEREDIEEQMRLDEQAALERQNTQNAGANISGGQSAAAEPDISYDDMSLEELMADAMQSDVQMLDLVSGLDMFIEDFSELMKDTMDEMDGLSELAEELMGVSAEPDMDPEDLKELKLKHRAEEQRKIAEADSKYLKALFQKLQREQQAVAQGAAKIAEAIAGDSSAMLSLTGSSTPAVSKAGAAPAGASSGKAAAVPAAEAPVELISLSSANTSADVPAVSTSAAVSVVAAANVSFDVSV